MASIVCSICRDQPIKCVKPANLLECLSFNSMNNSLSYRIQNVCEHIFCFSCLNGWMETTQREGVEPNCPLCRRNFSVLKIVGEQDLFTTTLDSLAPDSKYQYVATFLSGKKYDLAKKIILKNPEILTNCKLTKKCFIPNIKSIQRSSNSIDKKQLSDFFDDLITSLKTSDNYTGYLLDALVDGYMESDIQKAEHFALCSDKRDLKDDLLLKIGNYYLKKEKFEDVERIADLIQEPYKIGLLLKPISFKHLSNMHFYNTSHNINEALRLASKISCKDFSNSIFQAVAKLYLQKKHLKKTYEVALLIPDPDTQYGILKELAEKYLALNRFNEARKIVETNPRDYFHNFCTDLMQARINKSEAEYKVQKQKYIKCGYVFAASVCIVILALATLKIQSYNKLS